MLAPVSRPISEEQEPVLKWPDRSVPVTGRMFGVLSRGLEYAYIRDDVLREYENRDEFDVSPDSGSVSYNGWWAVSYGTVIAATISPSNSGNFTRVSHSM